MDVYAEPVSNPHEETQKKMKIMSAWWKVMAIISAICALFVFCDPEDKVLIMPTTVVCVILALFAALGHFVYWRELRKK